MGRGRDYFVILKMGHHIQQLRTIVSPIKIGVFAIIVFLSCYAPYTHKARAQ